MKKNKLYIKLIILIVVLFNLTGCNSQTAGLSQKDTKKSSIIISPTVSKLSTNGLTMFNKTVVDIDGDGRLDQIESYTSAKRMPDGTMAWDDGQKWVLSVTCNNQQYILFDDYVQLAELKFFAYVDSGSFHIAILQEGQFLTVSDYYFDEKKKIFVGSKKFSMDGATKIYYPQRSN